jgi:hypothetical protein
VLVLLLLIQRLAELGLHVVVGHSPSLRHAPH